MAPLRAEESSLGHNLFGQRHVTNFTELREGSQEALVDDCCVHGGEIGAHPGDHFRLGDRRTEQPKRTAGEEVIEGRRFDDTDGGVQGSAGHPVDNVILLGEVILASRVGANMDEPMALELRQTATGVLDEVLVENVFAFRGLPASTCPAREPLGEALDGVIRVRIDDELFVVEASVVEQDNGAMDGREFGPLIGLRVSDRKTLGAREMTGFGEPDRKSSLRPCTTIA
jgi:hypothetical protein